MKARYRSLELKVNSEVDKCPGKIPSAQTLARLAKDVEYDERRRNNTKNEIRKSKTRHHLWLENGETGGVCDMGTVVKADYRKLVEQAKTLKVSGRAGVGAISTTTATSSSLSSEKGGGTTDMSNGGNMYEEEVMGVAGQWIPYSSSPWSFCIPENFTPFFYNSDSGEWQLEVPEDVEVDRTRMVVEGVNNTSSVPKHMCFIPTLKFLTVVDQNPSHYQYKDSTVNEQHLVMRNLAAASPDPLSTTTQDSLLEKSRGVDDGCGGIVSSVHSSSPRMNRTLLNNESRNTTIANLLNNVSQTSNENKSGKGSIQHDNIPNNTTNGGDSTTTGEAATECIEVRSDERNMVSDLTEKIWECTSCTFHNIKMDAISCDMCLHPRPTPKLKSSKIQGRKRQTTIVGISSVGHVCSKKRKSAK